MAAASAEPHPSSPARPPSLSFAPKLLPRDKQTRRQGRPSPALPPPRRLPPPRPGPVWAPASELRLQPPARDGACARQRLLARPFLPPFLPPAPGTSGPGRIGSGWGLNVAAAVCAGPWAASPAGSASRAESRPVRTPPPPRPSPPPPSVKLSFTDKE